MYSVRLKRMIFVGLMAGVMMACVFGMILASPNSLAAQGGSIDPTEPFGFETDKTADAAKGGKRSATSLNLDAVFISGEKQSAIINNTLLKVGDKIGTYTVKTIEPYKVTLIAAGESRETVLELFGKQVKEPTK